jgi:phage tail-like protein
MPDMPSLPSRLPEQSALDARGPDTALPAPDAPPLPSMPSRLPEQSVIGATPPEPRPGARDTEDLYRLGLPPDRSNWASNLQPPYDEMPSIGRYLLIFESMLAPVVWTLDNADAYLSPDLAPAEWRRWVASWFDVLLLPGLAEAQQRRLLREVGWLFLRRGTRPGLARMLELYFGVEPEIIENDGQACHFTVRLPLGRGQAALSREVAVRILEAQKPAFAGYTLEIV